MVVPIGVIVAVAIVFVVVAALSSAERADDVAVENERQLFSRALTNQGERVLRDIAAVATSEAAYRRIRVDFDSDWVQISVGLRLQSFFDHDFVFITDPSNNFLYASLGRRKWRAQYRADIRDATPAGQTARDNLVRIAQTEQRKGNEMIGAELGYRYVDSPIICDIPGGPEHRFRDYRPTTWPGARLPHVWLDDGTPIQDRISGGYTVLRLGGTRADTAGLEQAIKSRGAPVEVLDIPDNTVREVYQHDILLLRPDMHVVWRGNRLPDDVQEIAATATGH